MILSPTFAIRDCRIDGWGALLDVDDRQKQLLRPVRYRWLDCYGLQEHEAPQGYTFDGATKWAGGIWRVMGPPWGGSAKAALLHDRCFTERFILNRGPRITLEYAAELYLCYLEATGVNWAQRNIEFLAVQSPIARRMWRAHDHKFRGL